ncbi:branched-chain amino acid ABC transporter permease [Dactylosporangium sp. NPDC048998]|uniref:branched-chain amino acid ABC transporter permease n=1 Tax=Dactylosporangium sp. NPDC048998 TaxID=3363976 RepID=UPI00371EB1F4
MSETSEVTKQARRLPLRGWYANLPRPARWAVLAVFAALAYLLPYVGDIPLIGPQIITTGIDWPTALFYMSYYVLLALGLNVVVGFAGLLDLGYVGFFAVGALTVAVLTSPDSQLQTKWSWLAAVPVAIALSVVSGLILGWPTLRLRGDYLAIVTLGFAEIIRTAADSSEFLRGDRGFTKLPHPPGNHSNGKPIFGIIDATPYFWLGLTLVILVVIGARNLERSRVGRSWLAIREDEEAAEVMGVRTVKFKLWAFAIGASIGGFGGVLFAGQPGFVNSSTFQLLFSILVLAGVVMGGSGNIPGAILGGVLISYIPDRLRNVEVFGTDAFEYRFLIFGLLIILIMIFRPQGIIPSRRRAAELKDRAKEVQA